MHAVASEAGVIGEQPYPLTADAAILQKIVDTKLDPRHERIGSTRLPFSGERPSRPHSPSVSLDEAW